VGIRGLGRDSFVRAAPVVVSVALHLALVCAAAVIVPRASARILDTIVVDLVAAEPPRVVEPAPVPPAPPKRLTLPKPIVRATPKPEAKPEPPATRPETSVAPPPPAEPAPPQAAAAPASTTPADTSVGAAAPAGGAPPLGSGVAWIDNTTTASAASGRAVASIPAPAAVTRVARPTGGYQVRPSYPSTARRLGVQGTTVLRVHVLDDGKVGEVAVDESAGHPDLDQAATEAVRRWRFEPARRGDEAVAMWVRVPVEFRLK